MNNSSSVAHLSATPRSLKIEWADGRVSEIPSVWLRDNCPGDRDACNGQRLVDLADLPRDPQIRSALIQSGAMLVEWESLAELRGNRTARLAWLTRLLQDGIAFMRELPCDGAALLNTVDLIGQVLETNYGRVFDVRSVPGFQALHVVAASPEGGASLFADAPLRLPASQVEPFYASYRLFASLSRDARFQLELHLSNGNLVVFDNRRVLHGRTAFSSAKFLRHLRGCYLTRDSVYSETALLRPKLT
jgi:hypothetical protein